MKPNNSETGIEKSSFFENLFAELEERDDYHVAGMKIEIAEQIFLQMKKKKVNKAELARKLGKNRAYISRILKGNTNFTIETLVTIGRRLDAEWSFKLTDNDEKKKKADRFIDMRWSEHVIPPRVYSISTGNEVYTDVLMANGA